MRSQPEATRPSAVAIEEGELSEVGVLGDDQVAVLTSVIPDLAIGCGVETEGGGVAAVGKGVS